MAQLSKKRKSSNKQGEFSIAGSAGDANVLENSTNTVLCPVIHTTTDLSPATNNDQTLQVPDFCSFTLKEIKSQLKTYCVSISQNKSKNALAGELKQHFLTKTLPELVKKHPGYLNYQGINYRFCNQNKRGFIFRCSRYLHPVTNSWTNRKAVKAAFSEMDGKHKFTNCVGTLFVELTVAGTLSLPQLPAPFHSCGCLNSIQSMDLGYQDSRPVLEMISPSINFVDVITADKRQVVIESLSARSTRWDGLTGGKFGNQSLRKFVLDLTGQPKINRLVERVMAPLVNIVQAKYPTLRYVKYGALKSEALCPSQYEGHDNMLHTDYEKLHLDIPPHQRPVSIIMALNEFKFIYLPHLTLTRKDLVTLTVPPGHGIIFTNACLHSGGENDSDDVKYRLFAYMASELSHIPHNKVQKFKWSSADDHAKISFSTATGGEDEDGDMVDDNVHLDNTDHGVGKVTSAY